MARGYGGGRPLVRNSARATSQLADAGELRCRDPTASVVRPISTQSVRKRSVRPPAGHAGEVAQTRLANPFPPTPTTGRQRSAVWGTRGPEFESRRPDQKAAANGGFCCPERVRYESGQIWSEARVGDRAQAGFAAPNSTIVRRCSWPPGFVWVATSRTIGGRWRESPSSSGSGSRRRRRRSPGSVRRSGV